MPTRNYQHADRGKRRTHSPAPKRIGPKPSYSKMRRAYQRGAKGKFDLKSATREQITDLRNRIIARRLQRITVGIIILVILMAMALVGVRYILIEYREAREKVMDETGFHLNEHMLKDENCSQIIPFSLV